jgi:hypothetical protein
MTLRCATCGSPIWKEHPRAPLAHSNRLPNAAELDADHPAKLALGRSETPYVPPVVDDRENHRALIDARIRHGSHSYEDWQWDRGPW